MRHLRARFARVAVAFALSALLGGCISVKSFVDPALPVLAKTDLPAVASPRPVTVLFEFKTNGNANARGTSALQGRAVAAVAESGMFGAVSSTAGQPQAGLLKITIDDIGDAGKAAAKGFGTGLTFGLAGSLVTDNYLCTAAYSLNGRSTETTVRHALHSTVGNHKPPPGAKPMTTMDAINQVVDQLVWHALKQLDEQAAFAGQP